MWAHVTHKSDMDNHMYITLMPIIIFLHLVNVFSFLQSIINVQNQAVEMDQDKCKTFLQKHEQELRHFGKLDAKCEEQSRPRIRCVAMYRY